MRRLLLGIGCVWALQSGLGGCADDPADDYYYTDPNNPDFDPNDPTWDFYGDGTEDDEEETDPDATDDDITLPEFGIAGSLKIAPTAKRMSMANGSEFSAGYVVYASSDHTGENYEGETDANGNFSIDIPKEEAGNTFVITIVNPLGHAEGPVILGADGANGVTGFSINESTSLGAIDLPDDPSAAGILAGDSNTVGSQLNPQVAARLDNAGVPVGVASIGKGEGADGPAATGGWLDADQDGLIDIFDADNDGNGIVDDFEGAIDFGGLIPQAGVNPNFFMNLKIAEEDADTYYNGTQDEIDAALALQTVITFELVPEPSSKEIVGVHMAKFPAPAYLPAATKMVDTGFGLTEQLWSDSDYAFDKAGDRWQAFVYANDLIEAGDMFAVIVDFADGTSIKYRRMINYVFKSIPRLVQHGTPSSQNPYAGGAVDFDGMQDVVLTFEPPIDETGAFLTDFDYFFEIFYTDLSGQQIQNIDWATTFGGPAPAGFDNGKFVVHAADLGPLSADGTYTVTLPAAIFVSVIFQNDATVQSVGGYKVDIAAQNSGNAAVMLPFVKH